MEAIEYARSNRDRYLAELQDFLRIPSVSTQPEHKPDIERAAAWLRDQLGAAGFPRARVIPTGGYPVVYAEWRTAVPDAPTILVYGHYDVQPSDPLGEWRTPPFEPTVVGDDLYARGAADDKGQLYTYVKAVEALKETAGAPPVNVKCLFEGEEESGSLNLESFILQNLDLLTADVAMISDSHMLAVDQPSIAYALRGEVYLEVEITGPDRDLHSGLYGGAVHNPINALCHMIASLQDEQGWIAIPGFYDKVQELEPEERADLIKIPFERQAWLREAGVRADWGEPEYTIVERTAARPTLDVSGIWGGYTQPGVKTVLPSKAQAKISMRLVPDQESGQIMELVRRHLIEIAPPTVHVQVRELAWGEPVIVRRDSPAMEAAFGAYAEVFGREPLLVREGGTIPVVATLRRALGLETILMGFGLPDDRLHSPNEKFHLPNFYRGIETILHFMDILGRGGFQTRPYLRSGGGRC